MKSGVMVLPIIFMLTVMFYLFMAMREERQIVKLLHLKFLSFAVSVSPRNLRPFLKLNYKNPAIKFSSSAWLRVFL
jgi:hypothetical protein